MAILQKFFFVLLELHREQLEVDCPKGETYLPSTNFRIFFRRNPVTSDTVAYETLSKSEDLEVLEWNF